MTNPDDRFREIAEQLRQGTARSESVRTVLSWFGFKRRSAWFVARIRTALKNAGLETTPDVWSTYLDGHLRFTLHEEISDKPASGPVVETTVETSAESQATTVAPLDPTY